MSTSSSLARDPETKPEARAFSYADVSEGRDLGLRNGTLPLSGPANEQLPLNREDEAEKREAIVRVAGEREGEAKARLAFDSQLAQVRESVLAALKEFARQRNVYYEQVEAEIVQLSLGIARRILHRESQVDPLLLAGLVRVALNKIQSGTRVVVRVHPHQVAECNGYFAHHLEAHDVPVVTADPTLEMDRCVLETELGVTELGVEVQLKEIERGLMDLLAQRPRATPI
jgi:flagellar assembly protein FliH